MATSRKIRQRIRIAALRTRVAQEIVAKRIIAMAQRGEREPTQPAADAAAYLAHSYA